MYFDSLTHEKGFINAAEWEKMRPFMVMVDPNGVEAIKLQWAEACRMAGLQGKKCNASLKSLADILFALDGVTQEIIKGNFE